MTVNGNDIGLNVTDNPNIAPPGWYMLFVIERDRRPVGRELGAPRMNRWLITRATVAVATVAGLTGLVVPPVPSGHSTNSTLAASTLGSPTVGPAAVGSSAAPPTAGAGRGADTPGADVRVATPAPTVTGTPPPAAASSNIPGPHLQPYALDLAGSAHPAQAQPTAPLAEPISVDGCDHDYAKPNQCVPTTYPAGVTDRCAWLLSHRFGPMTIVGTDREHLDTDHNGVACDPGDA